MADTEHTVTLSAENGGYVVAVSPTPDGATWDKSYPDYPGARGYARGLRLYRGWKLLDLVGDAK